MALDSNIVVNIILAPQPTDRVAFGTLLIAGSTMGAGFTETTRDYTNSDDVDADSDLGSVLSNMVKSGFDQSPTPDLIKVGKLSAQTAEISNIAVSNPGTAGDVIEVTVLGQLATYTVQGGDTDLLVVDGIVAALQALSKEDDGRYTVTDNGADFDIVGANAEPLGVILNIIQTGGLAATLTTPTPPVTIQTGLSAIETADSAWYGLALESSTHADMLEAAAWVETREKLLIVQSNDADILDALSTIDIAAELQTLTRLKTAVMYHDNTLEYAAVAWLAKKLTVDLDSQTTHWYYATLAGITALDATALSATQQSAAFGKNANVYTTLRGVGSTAEGTVADGNKIDIVTTSAWVKDRMESAVSDLFLRESNANRKVPYTDKGINQIAGLLRAILAQGVDVEHFADGGTSLTIPKLADITPADRTARLLRLTFSAVPAGAIEKVTITGYVAIPV